MQDSQNTFESSRTLENKINLISDIIDLTLNSFNTQEFDLQQLVNQLYAIEQFYSALLRKMIDGAFDFDPEIRKLKGLLNHDLRKSLTIITPSLSMVKLDNSLFDNLREGIWRSLLNMRACIRIINAINKSNFKNIKLSIPLSTILDMLPTIRVSDTNFAMGRDQEYVEVHVESVGDTLLTVEQFFSINTLLINLMSQDVKACFSIIEIIDENWGRTIRIFDDAGYVWPKKIIKDYHNLYLLGYNDPLAVIDHTSKGLGMVFYLGGQRHNVTSTTESMLVNCVDAMKSPRGLKYIELTYPNLQNISQ